MPEERRVKDRGEGIFEEEIEEEDRGGRETERKRGNSGGCDIYIYI